jgi:hypothetical protein
MDLVRRFGVMWRMGPERKDELAADNRVDSRQQVNEAVHLTSKRLREEAQHLLREAERLVGLSAALREKRAPWTFTASCDRGHQTVESNYDRSTLWELLHGGEPIRLYCRSCNRHWTATEDQRARIDWALRNSE